MGTTHRQVRGAGRFSDIPEAFAQLGRDKKAGARRAAAVQPRCRRGGPAAPPKFAFSSWAAPPAIPALALAPGPGRPPAEARFLSKATRQAVGGPQVPEAWWWGGNVVATGLHPQEAGQPQAQRNPDAGPRAPGDGGGPRRAGPKAPRPLEAPPRRPAERHREWTGAQGGAAGPRPQGPPSPAG